MAEVLYPEYRAYVDSRVDVNDAMTALLAGSRLAAHTLQLTEGSTHTLREVFPSVEHIRRFNLRSDEARGYLLDADHHLASVALPYALATHEDFVSRTLELLKDHDRVLATGGKPIRAWNMHTIFFDTCNSPEPSEWMQSFHVLRELRNCVTHAGGGVSERLIEAITDMGDDARDGWSRINLGAAPEGLTDGGRVRLTAELIFTAFAVTKQIGRAINVTLSSTFTAAEWARIIVNDFAGQTRKPRNSSGWRRALIGYARQYYAPLSVEESALEGAARELGEWTRARWSE